MTEALDSVNLSTAFMLEMGVNLSTAMQNRGRVIEFTRVTYVASDFDRGSRSGCGA